MAHGGGETQYRLTLNSEDFEQALERCQEKGKEFMLAFGEGLGLGVFMGGIEELGAKFGELASSAIPEAIDKVTELAHSLEMANAMTGASVQALQEFGAVAGIAGLGLDNVTGMITKMEKAFSSGKISVDALGLSMDTLMSEDPAQAFKDVLGALAALGPGMDQTSAAMQIFGKSGAAALQLIRVGATDASSVLDELNARISDEGVAAAVAYHEATAKLGIAWDGLIEQFGAAALEGGGLTDVVKSLTAAIVDVSTFVSAHTGEISRFFEVAGGVIETGISGARTLVGFLSEIAGKLPGLGGPVGDYIMGVGRDPMEDGGGKLGSNASLEGRSSSGINLKNAPPFKITGDKALQARLAMLQGAYSAFGPDQTDLGYTFGQDQYALGQNGGLGGLNDSQLDNYLGKLIKLKEQGLDTADSQKALDDALGEIGDRMDGLSDGALAKLITQLKAASLAGVDVGSSLDEALTQRSQNRLNTADYEMGQGFATANIQTQANLGGFGMANVRAVLPDVVKGEIAAWKQTVDDAAGSLASYNEKLLQQIQGLNDAARAWGEFGTIFSSIGTSLGAIFGKTSSGAEIFGGLGTGMKTGQGLFSQMASIQSQVQQGSITPGMGTAMGLGAAGAAGLSSIAGAYSAGASGGVLAGAESGVTSGAMTGMAIGSIFPGIGNVVGAIGGAIAGGLAGVLGGLLGKPEFQKVMDDAGQKWGISLSQSLAKTIASDESGLGRGLAEALNIGDIMKEGVAQGKSPTAFAGDVNTLMEALKNGAVPASKAVSELGTAFTQLWTAAQAGDMGAEQGVISMIARAKQLGETIPAMQQAIAASLKAGASGLDEFFKNIGIDSAGKQQIQSGNQAIASQEILGALFDAEVSQVGAMQATQDMQSAFKDMLKSLPKGAPIPPEAAHAMQVMTLMQDKGFAAAATGAAGLGQTAGSLLDTGNMTPALVSGLGTSLQSLFNQAMGAKGATRETSLEAVLPLLTQLEKAKELGATLDPASSKLLSEAQKDNLLPLQTVQEKQLGVLMNIQGILGSFKGAGAFPGGPGGGPSVTVTTGGGGVVSAGGGIPHLAGGGIVRGGGGGVLAMIGEDGPEAVIPLNRIYTGTSTIEQLPAGAGPAGGLLGPSPAAAAPGHEAGAMAASSKAAPGSVLGQIQQTLATLASRPSATIVAPALPAMTFHADPIQSREGQEAYAKQAVGAWETAVKLGTGTVRDTMRKLLTDFGLTVTGG